MKLLDQIESKNGFVLPAAYRELAESGLLNEDFYLPDGYLMAVEEVASFSWDDHLPAVDGLVPFARNGAGEHYCWYVPKPASNGETNVVLAMPGCKAPFFAPSFAGMVFRDAVIWYSMMANDDEDYEALPNILKLIEGRGPDVWCDTLRGLKDLPAKVDRFHQPCLYTNEDMDVLFGDLFGAEYVTEELEWQVLD